MRQPSPEGGKNRHNKKMSSRKPALAHEALLVFFLISRFTEPDFKTKNRAGALLIVNAGASGRYYNLF